METLILKSKVEQLIKIHLELTDLRLQEAENIKHLGVILNEKLNDSQNPAKNILKFENLEFVSDYDTICEKIHADINSKQNEFKSIAKEISDLFPNIWRAVKTSGCGFSFVFPYQDIKYMIKMERVWRADIDRIEFHLFNDLTSNIRVGFTTVDFKDANFNTDYSSVTRVLEQAKT